MKINEFIKQFRNHPVLFIGAGLSLRYLHNSYTWDSLLKTVSKDFTDNNEFYLDTKSICFVNGKYDYSKIATIIEAEFNSFLSNNRDGKFKKINDKFYIEMESENNLSRFKIYISDLLGGMEYKEDMNNEIAELKKTRKNVGSVITTNYDGLIEDIFGFDPLIGNNILLSNPYGSVYKIHGCCSIPSKLIITEDDYIYFDKKYDLIM